MILISKNLKTIILHQAIHNNSPRKEEVARDGEEMEEGEQDNSLSLNNKRSSPDSEDDNPASKRPAGREK